MMRAVRDAGAGGSAGDSAGVSASPPGEQAENALKSAALRTMSNTYLQAVLITTFGKRNMAMSTPFYSKRFWVEKSVKHDDDEAPAVYISCRGIRAQRKRAAGISGSP